MGNWPSFLLAEGFHWSSHHHAANEKYGEILPNEPKVSPGLFGHVLKGFVTI